jgi:hypothetical protein
MMAVVHYLFISILCYLSFIYVDNDEAFLSVFDFLLFFFSETMSWKLCQPARCTIFYSDLLPQILYSIPSCIETCCMIFLF